MNLFIKTIIALFLLSNIAGANEKYIAISQTISHPALDNTLKGIIDTLNLKYENKVKIEIKNAQGNLVIANQIAKNLLAKTPDVIIAIGTPAAQAFIKSNKIPIIFSSVTDPAGAGLTGKNFYGISNYIDPFYQLKEMQKIGIKKIAMIYNPSEINSVLAVHKTNIAAKNLGIKFTNEVAINTKEVPQAVYKIADKNVDAIFINNDNTALSAFSAIVKIANKFNIKVISGDIDNIENGAFMAVGSDQYKIGKETANMAINLLDNKTLNERIKYLGSPIVKFNKYNK